VGKLVVTQFHPVLCLKPFGQCELYESGTAQHEADIYEAESSVRVALFPPVGSRRLVE